jgi:hypothetical protein
MAGWGAFLVLLRRRLAARLQRRRWRRSKCPACWRWHTMSEEGCCVRWGAMRRRWRRTTRRCALVTPRTRRRCGVPAMTMVAAAGSLWRRAAPGLSVSALRQLPVRHSAVSTLPTMSCAVRRPNPPSERVSLCRLGWLHGRPARRVRAGELGGGPSTAALWHFRALALRAQGDGAQAAAEASLRTALELAPAGRAEAWVELA